MNARVTAIGRAVARFAWDNVAVVAIVAAWALWVVIGQVNRVVMPSTTSTVSSKVDCNSEWRSF